MFGVVILDIDLVGCCFVRPPAELSTPPLERASRLAQERLTAGTGLRQDAPPPLMGYARAGPPEQDAPRTAAHAPKPGCMKARGR